MALISMIMALAVPQFAGSLGRLNSETAARKIAAALRYARSRSASEKASYGAKFIFDENRMILRKYRGMTPPQTDDAPEDTEAPQIYDLPEGVRLEKGVTARGKIFDAEPFFIFFSPTGASSGGSITLTDEKERRFQISVDFITGIINVAQL